MKHVSAIPKEVVITKNAHTIGIKFIMQDNRYIPEFYFLNSEIDLACLCLRGEYRGTILFQDLSYAIRLTTTEITLWDGMYNDSEAAIRHRIVISGPSLAARLEYVKRNAMNVTMSSHEILSTLRDIAPHVKWILHDHENIRMRNCLSNLINSPVSPKGLTNGLRSISRIARNYSAGNRIEVNFCFDHMPPQDDRYPSFYWYILSAGERIMNGGLIAHYYDGRFEGYSFLR